MGHTLLPTGWLKRSRRSSVETLKVPNRTRRRSSCTSNSTGSSTFRCLDVSDRTQTVTEDGHDNDLDLDRASHGGGRRYDLCGKDGRHRLDARRPRHFLIVAEQDTDSSSGDFIDVPPGDGESLSSNIQDFKSTLTSTSSDTSVAPSELLLERKATYMIQGQEQEQEDEHVLVGTDNTTLDTLASSSSINVPPADCTNACSSATGSSNSYMKEACSATTTAATIPESSGSNSRDKKSVRFSTIHVREYTRCPGINPSALSGVPLSIGWTIEVEHSPITIEEYEAHYNDPTSHCSSNISAAHRRGLSELRVGAMDRMELLMAWGYSRGELKEVIQQVDLWRAQRSETVTRLRKDRSSSMLLQQCFHFFMPATTRISKVRSTRHSFPPMDNSKNKTSAQRLLEAAVE